MLTVDRELYRGESPDSQLESAICGENRPTLFGQGYQLQTFNQIFDTS